MSIIKWTLHLQRILFMLGMWIALLPSADATHIMGADLSYTCLGGNTYQFQLTIYRNCEGEQVKPQTDLFFRSNTCGIPEFSLKAQLTESKEVDLYCPSQSDQTSCHGGPLLGIEQHTYTLTHTFQDNCPDWTISWRLCCRNQRITTLRDPAESKLYIETTLNTTAAECNQSPQFTSAPIPMVCAGVPYYYHQGVVDPDGDSLAFELVTPLSYLGNDAVPLTFIPPFSAKEPISTQPVNPFHLDPASGQLSFTPNLMQQGVIAIKVKEYRNGIYIGSTMRDMQIIVLDCENQPPSIVSLDNQPVADAHNPDIRQTYSVCIGNSLSFSGKVKDPENEALSLITNLAEQIPNASLAIKDLPDRSKEWEFFWAPTLADTGNHFFSMSWEDRGCPLIGRQSIGFHIRVDRGTILPPKLLDYCPNSQDPLQLEASTPSANGGTYSWSPTTGLSDATIRRPIVQLNAPTSYVVTYTEGGACPIIERIVIRPSLAINFEEEEVHICQGDSANIQAELIGIDPNEALIQWSPSEGLSDPTSLSPIASPQQSQLYSLRVEAPGCSLIQSIWVFVDRPLSLDSLPNRSTCQGIPISLLADGTTLPIGDYRWSPGLGLDDPLVANPSASPERSTTYTLIAQNGCGETRREVNVEVVPALQASVEVEDVSCAGSLDGRLTAYGTGGKGTIRYTWTPGAVTTPVYDQLGSGNYQLTAVDELGCKDTVEVVINEPEELTGNIVRTLAVSCARGNDGAIQVQANGGTPPYFYALNDSIFTENNFFTGLGPGTYTYSVQDAQGCTFESPPVTLAPAASLEVELVDKIDASCNAPLGEIRVVASGGVAPYRYSLDGEQFQNVNVFIGLSAGRYIVSVQDSQYCESFLEVIIHEIEDPIAQIDTIISVSCFGRSDGQISLSASGGVAPYTFQLDGEDKGDQRNFQGLASGRHEVVLTDSLGCEFGVAFDIPESDPIQLIHVKIQEPRCHGDTNASVRLLGWGGTAPYEFAGPSDEFLSSPVIEHLTAGVHQFRVRDSFQCEDTILLNILQPEPLEVIVDSINTPTCAEDANASVLLSGQGGNGSYRYVLSDRIFSTSGIFKNIEADDYLIYIQDRKGCKDSSVLSIEVPPPFTASISNTSDVSCFGGADGTIELSVTGGVPAYEFRLDGQSQGNQSLMSSLEANMYILQIEDANGCIRELEAHIGAPEPFKLRSDWDHVSCFGASDGFAEVIPAGGSSPYLYRWSDGSESSLVGALGPGTFEVKVLDGNGCEAFESFEIYEPEEIVLDSMLVDSVSCAGDEDGAIEIRASGGHFPISYQWAHGPVDSILTGLAGGMYQVTIRDSENCTLEQEIALFEPQPLTIQLLDSLPATCDLNNGSLEVSISGGRMPYLVNWDGAYQGADTLLTALDSGFYQLFVMDENGCEQQREVVLPRIPQPIASFSLEEEVDSVMVGQPLSFTNYSQFTTHYRWDFGDGNVGTEKQPTHAFQTSGLFHVSLIAEDAQAVCRDSFSLAVNVLPEGKMYMANAFSPNNDGTNDRFVPVGEGIQWIEGTIYNRWGTVVFRFSDPQKGWDGNMMDGLPAPHGVYVYQLKAGFSDGTSFQREGSVTLMR